MQPVPVIITFYVRINWISETESNLFVNRILFGLILLTSVKRSGVCIYVQYTILW